MRLIKYVSQSKRFELFTSRFSFFFAWRKFSVRTENENVFVKLFQGWKHGRNFWFSNYLFSLTRHKKSSMCSRSDGSMVESSSETRQPSKKRKFNPAILFKWLSIRRSKPPASRRECCSLSNLGENGTISWWTKNWDVLSSELWVTKNCLLRSKQNKNCLNVGDKTKNESLSWLRKRICRIIKRKSSSKAITKNLLACYV